MRNKLAVLSLVSVFVAAWPSVAMAQQGPPPFQLGVRLQVNPGMAVEFEANVKRRAARLAAGNFTFQETVFVSDELDYSFVTNLQNMADLDTRRQQLEALPPPANPGSLRGVVEHLDTRIRRPEPELSYAPEDRRLQPGDIGFFHGIYLYPHLGTTTEVTGILEKFVALYEQHNVRDGYVVFSQVMGSDSPVIEVFIPARDAADYYTQAAKTDAMLGDGLQTLLSELLPLCRRLEQSDWTRRPDLDYRPTN